MTNTRLRTFVRRTSGLLAKTLPMPFLQRMANTPLFMPFYHVVSNDYLPHISPLYPVRSVKTFKDDLDFLCRHFKPVGLGDILAFIKEGKSLPENSFHLTFDDGLSEMAEIVAPILYEKAIPATFFVNNDFIDNKAIFYRYKTALLCNNFMKSDEAERASFSMVIGIESSSYVDIRQFLLNIKYSERSSLDKWAMHTDCDFDEFLIAQRPYMTSGQMDGLIKQGFTIGAHSFDHPLFADITPEEQYHQCIESIKDIKARFKLDYGVFAFPFSDVGIKKEDYERLIAHPEVDALCGTSGISARPGHKVVQRYAMERDSRSAESSIRSALLVHWAKHLL